ncbi:MAG: hypothetical protein V7727_16485 [Sneathiella sp.]
MNLGLRRIGICVTLVLLACIACSSSGYEIGKARVDGNKVGGEIAYELSVNNLTFSPDGRHLVFDFHEFAFEKRRISRSRISIGLYNLKDETVTIIDPPVDPETGFDWHSPSFDPTGRKLVMVTSCITTKCSDQIYGTQIGILDLDNDKFSWITDARDKTYMWNYGYSPRGLRRSSFPDFGRSNVRGYPIFSADGKRIYHMMSAGAKGSIIFYMQFDAEYWLNVIELKGPAAGEDSSLLSYQDDAVIFKGDGRLSLAGNNRLIFSGWRGFGPSIDELDKRQPSAFIYDMGDDELSVAFDKNNTPLDSRFPAVSQYRLRSISASNNESRIAALSGKGDVVSLIDDGNFQSLLKAEDMGIDRFEQVVISGDGQQLVAVPRQKPFEPDDKFLEPNDIWLKDLNSGDWMSLPLKKTLRNAIDALNSAERTQ